MANRYDGGAGAGTGLDEPAGAEVRRPGRRVTEGPAGNNYTGAHWGSLRAEPGRLDRAKALLFGFAHVDLIYLFLFRQHTQRLTC